MQSCTFRGNLRGTLILTCLQSLILATCFTFRVTGFPLQSDPFTGLYNVSCVGNEPSIKNCPSFASPISTSCPSNYSATAICSGVEKVGFVVGWFYTVYLEAVSTHMFLNGETF